MTEPPVDPLVPMPVFFALEMPPNRAEGHYADFANIWHNQETFILDFIAMTQPPAPGQSPDGTAMMVAPCQMVTRVRIPASQCWEVMKALQAQLGKWEEENPHRKPPEPPM